MERICNYVKKETIEHANTLRWMWKLVAKLVKCILEHPNILNKDKPSRHDKSKSHIKVTYGHHILSGVSMSSRMLASTNDIIRVDFNPYDSTSKYKVY